MTGDRLRVAAGTPFLTAPWSSSLPNLSPFTAVRPRPLLSVLLGWVEFFGPPWGGPAGDPQKTEDALIVHKL